MPGLGELLSTLSDTLVALEDRVAALESTGGSGGPNFTYIADWDTSTGSSTFPTDAADGDVVISHYLANQPFGPPVDRYTQWFYVDGPGWIPFA